MEFGNDLNLHTSIPVVIWGTKTAAEICYRTLRKKNIPIAAVGDNNPLQWGKKFNGITILSAEQIKALYPNALIVVGSFRYDVSEAIIARLKQINRKFSFYRFEQIEYLYETEYLQRRINDKARYWHILHNIYREEESCWNRITDRNVISEYRYVMCKDWHGDIKSLLAEVYGIKTLYLIFGADRRNLIPSAVNELTKYGNIGHIIPVLDTLRIEEDREILKTLDGKAFYLICGENQETYQTFCSAEYGVPIEFRQLPDDLFTDRIYGRENAVTEEKIIQSVMDFVEGKKKKRKPSMDTCSKAIHIVQLFNGLANQMLMYLFGRFVEEESNRVVIFDDTILSLDVCDENENIRRMSRWNKSMAEDEVRDMVAQTRAKNSFYKFKRAEIAEVFDIPIRLLSDYFEEEIWQMYLDKIKKVHSKKYAQSFPLGQVLIEAGLDFAVVRDSAMPDEFLAVRHCYDLDTYVFSRPYERDSVAEYILHNGQTMYYMGIWATGRERDWLYDNRNWAMRQFAFPVDLDDINQAYAREIQKSDSIVVHIRRGDFVHGKMAADMAYFRNAIRITEAMESYKNKRYFVFSDDLDWCQGNEAPLGIDKIRERTVYVSGNAGENSYLDMYLMSLGKICIPTPGSSFDYVAILASRTIEKIVDVPRYLYNLKHGLDDTPLFIAV